MLIASGIPNQSIVCHRPDLARKERIRQFGRGHCTPLIPIVAGSYTTLTFQFETGAVAIPAGGRLAVAWRWPVDWLDLQTADPRGDGYVTISVHCQARRSPDPTLAMRCVHQGGFDPWQHHLELTVTQGTLVQGDRVQVVCGDVSGGGRGWRAPTMQLRAMDFLMLMDPDQSDRWEQLADTPHLSIVPGPPVRLVAIAPADGIVQETDRVIVRAEDQWGNTTALPQAASSLQVRPSAPDTGAITVDAGMIVCRDPVAYHFPIRFRQTGTCTLVATVSGTELEAESNPIRILAAPPVWRRYWGDLHSGQSEVGCGVGTLQEHFAFARDAGGLQFVTHQANDHYVTRERWQQIRDTSEDFHEPGRFVTFLGCEWSALPRDGGDRNVIYRRDESRLRRSGRFFVEEPADSEPDLVTAAEFLAALKHQPVLINMHVGGRPTNLDWHEPNIERLAEIHSTHGTSEWFIEDALSRGYRFGITAGTDGIASRPGGCHPGWRLNRNVRSGLTAVYAADLTRDALWEALQARRCYGTTGERIALWVEVDGQPMGSDHRTGGHPLVTIDVKGTAALETVELLRGTEVIAHWPLAEYPSCTETDICHRVRLLWSGTRQRGTARAQRVIWDGSLHVTHGHLLAAAPLNFHSAEDGIQTASRHQVNWQSSTAGNRAGLVLDIAGNADTVCRVTTAPAGFTFCPAQVVHTPFAVPAEGLRCQMHAGPAPSVHGPRQTRLTFRDTQPGTGTQAYWVRVTQVDQAQAWSSPVYVTRP